MELTPEELRGVLLLRIQKSINDFVKDPTEEKRKVVDDLLKHYLKAK